MRAGPQNLQLKEYSDRELLFIVDDLADEDRWVQVEAVAERVGLTHPNPTRCVVARFAWLRRYGVLEREEGDAFKMRVKAEGKRLTGPGREFSRWRLTRPGAAVVQGELTPEQEEMFTSLDSEQLLTATAVFGRKYRESDALAATLVRREWTFQTSARWNGRYRVAG